MRRLVEEDKVDFLFNTLGTPTNSAIQRYLNHAKVPHLFVATGADKWGDPQHFPWTIGLQPSYRQRRRSTPNTRCIKSRTRRSFIYQNDDFGKDYLTGVRDVLGADWDKRVIKVVSYEITDPTIDSQITALQESGADVLIVAAAPKQAAQAIRKVHDLNWHPLFFMTNVSISAGSVMQPAGAENGIGIITGGWLKDQSDPAWKDDAGMNEWRGFMGQHMPGADLTDNNYVYGFHRQPGDAARAECVQRRLLARERDEAGHRHQDVGSPDTAAGDNSRDQPDQLSPDPGHAAPEKGRQDLAPLRRCHRGGESLTGPSPLPLAGEALRPPADKKGCGTAAPLPAF